MIYCDTSLLISALTPEAQSVITQRWLADNLSRGLAISPWVDAEFAAAIAMKGRIGDLNAAERLQVLAQWRSLQRSLHDEPICPQHFRDAAALVALPDIKLRAGDALHMAIVRDGGFDLATLDKDFGAAATALSVVSINPLMP